MTKRAIFSSLLLVVVFLIGISSSAQQNRVEGYSGSVRIVPNSERNETTVVVLLSHALDKGSNQIVFHLQAATNKIPSIWEGQAQVLAADGVLAIVPKGQDRAVLFKFSETKIPSSLKQMSFEQYTVYGIARYGENKPLTPNQIEQLVTSGAISDHSTDGVKCTSGSGMSPNTTDPNPPVTQDCVAGGDGSTSCGAGGCTVTCGDGYYSCCRAGTCLCKPK